MRMRHAAVMAGLALALMSGAASAAPITQAYDFSFEFSSGPLSTIAGSFTATYDLAAQTGKLDSFSSNLPASYMPAQFVIFSTEIVIGNDCRDGSCYVNDGKDQFFFSFDVDNEGKPQQDAFAAYSSTTTPSEYFTPTTSNITLSAVPLPASAPMFAAALLAFGAVGYGVKRRKDAATA